MLRFMLAAIALLGIGAAVTAAAWEDRVYMEVEASGATFNVQGRIATGPEAPSGDTGWDGDWVESATEGDIELSALYANLVPGDTRTFWIQLRNTGNVTAYANGLEGSWTEGAFEACDPGNLPSFGGTTEDDPAILSPLAGGQESSVFELTLSVPDDWDAACMGASDRFVSFLQYTTDAPPTP